MEFTLDKEKHRQQVELFKHQNKVSEDRILYLKDMERKLKQIVNDWKRAAHSDDKKELMKQLQILLFRQQQDQASEKVKKKVTSKYEEIGGDIVPEIKKCCLRKVVKIGEVMELKGRKVVVKVGLMPITVDASDLSIVIEKPEDEKSRN